MKRRGSATSVFHQFRLARRVHVNKLYLFVEGYDDRDFYIPHVVAAFAKCAVGCLVCDGKDNVLVVRDQVYAKFGKCDLSLFFLDKDLDDLLSKSPADTRTFVTRYYAIENYLVQPYFVHYFFNVFARTGDERKVKRIVTDFELSYRRFSRRVLRIMAAVVALRRRGVEIHLSSTSIDKMVDLRAFTAPKLRAKWKDEIRKACSPPKAYVGRIDIEAELKIFDLSNPQAVIRGKYDLHFLVKWITAKWEELAKLSPPGYRRIRVHTQVTNANIISIFAPVVECPKDLLKFIEDYKCFRLHSCGRSNINLDETGPDSSFPEAALD